MWDFGSKPTFLIAQVPSDTNVTVDWDRFANYSSNSVHFTTSPTLVFGTVLNKVTIAINFLESILFSHWILNFVFL